MDYSLIIFDIDGTLTATASGATFRKHAADWKWLPGRLEKLKELKAQGIQLVVATNQGGVAFGHFLAKDILAELMRTLKEGGFTKAGLYVCYNHPKAKIEQYRIEDHRRKPGPGMLEEAMDDFDVDEEDTLFVGDRPEDEQAAKAAGCSFMWAKDFFGI